MLKLICQFKIITIGNLTRLSNKTLVLLVLLPLILLSFYSNPLVQGQDQQQGSVSENSSICQAIEDNKTSIGSEFYQAVNICNNQNSIGSSQALTELCYIFSDNRVSDLSAFCDQNILKQLPVSTNNTKAELNDKNNMGNQGSFTLFDGVTKFFSNIFHP